jgi:hypothetical protein
MKTIGIVNRLKRAPKWVWVVAPLCVIVLIVVWRQFGSARESGPATFTVRRGTLNITVLEGGSIRAVDSQEIKCEVRVGYQGIKILKLVEEGYEVTADDIRTNKVLVELDSSDLQKQIVQEDITYESAAANLTDAQENYEIQWNQNLSDIKAAEEKALFARMDFDKFLGDNVTQVIVDQLHLDEELAREATNAQALASQVTDAAPKQADPASAAKNTAGLPILQAVAITSATNNASGMTIAKSGTPVLNPLAVKPATLDTNAPPTPLFQAPKPVVIDFSKYASIEKLGDGEAKQKLRKLEDDLQVAQKEEGQAKVTLEGTRRLFEKGFVTKVDLEKDEIANENARLKVQTAETARDLFIKYEFPRTSEEDLSKHSEAVRELARAQKAAISKLAQAEAKLKSAQGQFNIQTRQRKELYEQLDKCSITAKRPGLVVYGGNHEDMNYYGGEERVREGATVRERQAIITIPDMTRMSVKVKIHETYIKKVKKGEKAKITVDAYPDTILDGEVTQVGVLPDSQNMWMNPDLKVYLTTVTINATNDWLKPGMTAKVEIMVNRLDDVVYVPVQAITPDDGKQICQVITHGRSADKRVVQIGEFNDEFIEIKSGLKQGDQVLLRAAEIAPAETKEETPDKTKPASPTAPQSKPPQTVQARKA